MKRKDEVRLIASLIIASLFEKELNYDNRKSQCSLY